ncbi:hypothetical protein ACOZ38_25615 [Sphaerisporangium viridialbum]|uniref:hypothetical protein n=1 Tax=Sphaerisporangium viridialbum TaxID=46189 RepID=UPI003C71DD3B
MTTPLLAPVVRDTLDTPDGAYIVLKVRENGGLVKARHLDSSSIWHLEPRDGTWTRI